MSLHAYFDKPHWRCWFVTVEWIRDKINSAEVQRTCQRTQCAKKQDLIIVSSAQRELCWYWDTAGDGDIVGWPSNGANLSMSLLSSNSCDQAQQDLLDDYQAFISQSMLDLFYYWTTSRVGKRRDQISGAAQYLYKFSICLLCSWRCRGILEWMITVQRLFQRINLWMLRPWCDQRPVLFSCL